MYTNQNLRMKNALLRLVSLCIQEIRYNCMWVYGLCIKEIVRSLPPVTNSLFLSYEKLFFSHPAPPGRKFSLGLVSGIRFLAPFYILQAELINCKPEWVAPFNQPKKILFIQYLLPTNFNL